MSVFTIYYKDGAKMMRPVLSREEYLALRGSERQKAIVKLVRDGDKLQKNKLVQMNYSCLPNEDGSLKGSKQPSSTVGMDIDFVAPSDLSPEEARFGPITRGGTCLARKADAGRAQPGDGEA